MDYIDRAIRIRDWGEPIIVAVTAIVFDYVNWIDLFESAGSFYDNRTIIVMLLLPTVIFILRNILYQPTMKIWNILTPIQRENFPETVLSRTVPYILMLAGFQLLYTRLEPVQVAANAGWLLLVPIPACIFGTIMVYRIKAMINYTKSAKYTRK